MRNPKLETPNSKPKKKGRPGWPECDRKNDTALFAGEVRMKSIA
jgi:hypothetical protein